MSALWLMLLALAANLLLVSLALPPRVLCSDEPVGYVDFMQHLCHARTFRRLMAQGRAWGYDPSLMAGYPALTVFDLDNKLLELAVALGAAFSLRPQTVMKWLLALELAAGPMLLYPAFRCFGFAPAAAALGVLGGVLISQSAAGLFFSLGGMVSHVCACYVSVLGGSLWYAYLSGNQACFWPMAAVTAIAPLIHSTAILQIGLPGLLLLFLNFPELGGWRLAGVSATLLAALLANIYWILPALRCGRFVTAWDRAWTGDFRIRDYAVFWGGGLCMTGGGLYALYALVRFFPSFYTAHGTLGILTFFMAVTPVLAAGPLWRLTRPLQPNRFFLVFELYLLPAALFRMESGAMGLLEKSLLCLTVAVPFGMLLLLRLSPRIPQKLFIPAKLFRRKLDGGNLANPRTRELIAWLREHTDPARGRVLIEYPQGSGAQSPFACFYLALVPALPWYVRGEFLGAPRYEAPLLQNRATRFSHDELLGVKLEEYDGASLRARLEQYNVGWIVAVEGPVTGLLDRYPDLLERKSQIAAAVIYETRFESGYFQCGGGTVRASINRLELSGLKGEYVVLKYHWMPGFRASDGTIPERCPVPGDETGFLALRHPAPEVTLTFRGPSGKKRCI